MAGPSRPVITLNKAMTHTQVYILSRLTVSRDHTRKQIYPNKNSPHPPPQDINISATWLLHQRSLISNRPHRPPLPPVPFLLPRQLPSDDNRLERLDPKGCPPLGRKSHPSYRTRRPPLEPIQIWIIEVHTGSSTDFSLYLSVDLRANSAPASTPHFCVIKTSCACNGKTGETMLRSANQRLCWPCSISERFKKMTAIFTQTQTTRLSQRNYQVIDGEQLCKFEFCTSTASQQLCSWFKACFSVLVVSHVYLFIL